MVNSKLRDAIYGFAVGDALGVPHEFQKRGEFRCTGMSGYGTWGQPAGIWSDDTSMVLATCDSIKHYGYIFPFDIMTRFMSWMKYAEYTADGKRFDIGNTTRTAIENFISGTDAVRCGLDEDGTQGNGSLMRILPLAFVPATLSDVCDVCRLTHRSPVCLQACIIYDHVARQLIEEKEVEEAILSWKNSGVESSLFERLTSIKKLKPKDVANCSGYVVDTLISALWCVATSYTYSETVLKAVNLGGDTDTVAALAGGLAGIIYGYNAIPRPWISALRNKELIESCLFI